MKKFLITLLVGLALVVPVLSTGGCAAQMQAIGEAVVPSSPEAIVKAAADGNTGAIVLATTLLQSHKITVAQAKGYRTVLKGAMDAIDEMNTTLVTCRAATGSTASTSPDPCRPSVISVISLSLKTITAVKVELDGVK